MDPIGRTWEGYKGGWWPADAVEHAATVFGGGPISTSWAFAGGVVPKDHPILPPSAYPPGTPTPGESPGPSPTAPTVVSDPMPVGDTPLGPDTPVGVPPPPIVPKFPVVDFATNLFQIEPGTGTLGCVGQPVPAGCPNGIVGVIDLGAATTDTGTSSDLKLLYANLIAPGTYQIIFESPPNTDASLWLWGSQSGAPLKEAPAESGILDGKSVSIATVTLDPTLDFSFVATATGTDVRLIGSVGSLNVSP
jgi:hypothetical protein